MKKIALKTLPYILVSLLIILYWKLKTLTSSYAWNPKGKEKLILEISLNSIFFYKSIFWLIIGNLTVFVIQNHKNRIQTLIAILSFIIILGFGKDIVNKKCANFYYNIFINQSVTEEYILEPIEDGGFETGKYLTENIEDKNIKYRRYAIHGIGKIKYDKAVNVLGKILNDKSEPEFIKNDVLESLKEINNYEANKIIKQFKK